MGDYRGSVLKERGDYDELNFGPQGVDLANLLEANREFEVMRATFTDDREVDASNAMSNPISTRKALSYFGLLLGTFGPLSILLKVIQDSGNNGGEYFFIALFLLANIITAAMGFITGSYVGCLIDSLKSYRWHSYLVLSGLAGVVWGIFSGGVGGIFLMIIGGIAGGVIGGIAAGIALPVYAVAHRLLSSGNHIELKHFLPVAFGTVFTLCALVLGL